MEPDGLYSILEKCDGLQKYYKHFVVKCFLNKNPTLP